MRWMKNNWHYTYTHTIHGLLNSILINRTLSDISIDLYEIEHKHHFHERN